MTHERRLDDKAPCGTDMEINYKANDMAEFFMMMM